MFLNLQFSIVQVKEDNTKEEGKEGRKEVKDTLGRKKVWEKTQERRCEKRHKKEGAEIETVLQMWRYRDSRKNVER